MLRLSFTALILSALIAQAVVEAHGHSHDHGGHGHAHDHGHGHAHNDEAPSFKWSKQGRLLLWI